MNEKNFNDFTESKLSLNLNKDDNNENFFNINIINNNCNNKPNSLRNNNLGVSNEINDLDNNDILSFDINININKDSLQNVNKKPNSLIERKSENQPHKHTYNLRKIKIKTEGNYQQTINPNYVSAVKKGKNSFL